MKKLPNPYVQPREGPPAGHDLYGHERTALSVGHEFVEFKDYVELPELGRELVQLGVSSPVFQASLC